MAVQVVGPVGPDEEEAGAAARALVRVQAYLARDPDGDGLLDLADAEGPVAVPRIAVELLARVLAHLASGQSVSIVPVDVELTTQQAANLLNVSRPYLIGLLEAGEIQYRKVGTKRRVLAGSLVEYKRRDDLRRREVADELSVLTQEMGLG